jgi:hypothetical protein
VTDYLLKFPSKQVAEQFGLANGFAQVDESGAVVSTLATHEYALHEIGAHNDSDFWVLFRDLVGIPIPAGGEQFIFWASASGLDRPTDAITAPNVFWA